MESVPLKHVLGTVDNEKAAAIFRVGIGSIIWLGDYDKEETCARQQTLRSEPDIGMIYILYSCPSFVRRLTAQNLESSSGSTDSRFYLDQHQFVI